MSNSNESLPKSADRSNDIDKEVQNLLRKNIDKPRSTYVILEDLKRKFKDDEIIESVMRKYNEKLKKVRKLADKIRDRLFVKYPHYSNKEYIEKISEYTKKYHFDDIEMQAIIHKVLVDKSNVSINTEILDTNYNEMSKALGFVPASYNMSSSLVVKKDEVEEFQGILNIAAMYKELHNQVTLQSLIYDSEDIVSIQGKFERSKILS